MLIVYVIDSCQFIIPMYLMLHKMMGMIRKGKSDKAGAGTMPSHMYCFHKICSLMFKDVMYVVIYEAINRCLYRASLAMVCDVDALLNAKLHTKHQMTKLSQWKQ